MERLENNVPVITAKIQSLVNSLKNLNDSFELARIINDILIHRHKIPINLISASWDNFAKTKGVINDS